MHYVSKPSLSWIMEHYRIVEIVEYQMVFPGILSYMQNDSAAQTCYSQSLLKLQICTVKIDMEMGSTGQNLVSNEQQSLH